MRFILDTPIPGEGTARFEASAPDVPLAQALFALDGIAAVEVTGQTILVTRTEGQDWEDLKAPVAAAIRDVLDRSDAPLGAAPQLAANRDAEILAAVNAALEARANPSIARHGGRVSAEAVENGIVSLRMSGGCQGCAASSRTLREGVEKMLRATVPGIRAIVDVTDHDQGTSPYYRGKAGEIPAFFRPVPPEAVCVEDGRIVIDPDFLAPRLGISVEDLDAGFRNGDITTERLKDGPSDRIRLAVRSRQRAWAAEILPDGTAHEIPPPREQAVERTEANALAERVRNHLANLPEASLPVTYAQLARGLGLYLPGSIRRVTSALETTMHEDARAGRPFIAARVVSRGPDALPGKGFFDLAKALGSGPEHDETDREFHSRMLKASGHPQGRGSSGD